ncbi:type II toxin-antitoxin system HigB family toxin [Bradyrhizobium sp. CCBAU 45384]|uniref:type II toxin-antitoxin system HigB family toxin n=1 Tax=Bradyrhizobium sp. CCBAU 45384 TaxID=858428 RepID=UPI0023063EAB|nr:type II toxin-antitoxin system HigB family toxin [Bradyrhizobium sp. CCBAU 45384]
MLGVGPPLGGCCCLETLEEAHDLSRLARDARRWTASDSALRGGELRCAVTAILRPDLRSGAAGRRAAAPRASSGGSLVFLTGFIAAHEVRCELSRYVFSLPYRLIAHFAYLHKTALIKFVGTHNDYDKIDAETV